MNVSRRFEGKVVAITGASAGVGRACVRAFASEGARLALIARSEEALNCAAVEARDLGADAATYPLDVSDAAALIVCTEDIERDIGPIDVWVNNAMVTVMGSVWDIQPHEFRRVTEVTYLGYVYGTQAALRSMRPRNKGTIVQVGSALEYRSIPLQSAYCGAKAAIRGFTDSLRTELLHENSGIRVTAVQLPAVNTPQFSVMRTKMPLKPMPVPPIFEPEAVADAILWAAERAPREVVVGFSSLQAIVGQRFMPSLLDRYLARNGFDAQLRDERVEMDRGDNLFDPVGRDLGARGSFSDQASNIIPQFVLRKNARAITIGMTLCAIAVSALTFHKHR